MFFGSRMVYMFALAVIVSTSAFLLASWPVIITIPVSILVGFIWWLIYYIVWERFNWKGPY
jgi:branched-subunit amino acid ABC-type transport system permease component